MDWNSVSWYVLWCFVFKGCGRVDTVWACAGGWLWCGTLYHCPSCCWPLGSTRKMWTAVRGDYYDRKLVINVFCQYLDGVFGIWGRVMLLSAFGFDQLQTFGQLQTEIRGDANCCPLASSLQAVHHTLRGWMLEQRLWIKRHFWKMNQGCGIMKRLCGITTWWFQKIYQSCRIMLRIDNETFLEDE